MRIVPIFFENAFIDAEYVLNDKPEKICFDVTINNTAVAVHTGKSFSMCFRKKDYVLEIPINGSVDRAIKFQLISKILRQENMENYPLS